MVKLTGLLVLLAAVACANMVTAQEKPCCQGHCRRFSIAPEYGVIPREKYYSIAPEYGVMRCNECCLIPATAPFWQGWIKELKKADNDSPCKVFGYTAYNYTIDNEIGDGFLITNDVYNLPKLSAAVPPTICKLVENQMLEKKVIDEICSKEHKMPTSECEAALTKLWDVITHKECPKVVLTAIPPMVCKLVKLPELEKKAVDAICSKQHILPAAECEEGLTKAWDALVKKECPDKVEITSETKPCCEGHCVDSSKAKYYSVAKSMSGKKHCGECCMNPKKYNLFHFFEKNLTKADNDSPCKVFGYTVYDSTDTHGFGPVSMTLDLYNQPVRDAIVV